MPIARVTPSHVQFDFVGADPREMDALARACAAVDSGLLLVTGTDTGMAYAAAEAAARNDLAGVRAHRGAAADDDLDIHAAVPAGATWTVGEVEELIMRPARLRPMHRTHILVADAHAMSKLAADRVLKAVEEPRTDVLFWFCAPTPESITVTLRSRAARSLPISPLHGSQLRNALTQAGALPGDLDTIISAAGSNARLALAVAHAGSPAVRALTIYGTLSAVSTSTPTAAADAGVSAIATLAAALAGRTRRAQTPEAAPLAGKDAWDRLDPRAKAEGRRLLQAIITRAATQTSALVPAATSAARLRALDAALAACAQARDELATNAAPLTVLSALLARVSGQTLNS